MGWAEHKNHYKISISFCLVRETLKKLAKNAIERSKTQRNVEKTSEKSKESKKSEEKKMFYMKKCKKETLLMRILQRECFYEPPSPRFNYGRGWASRNRLNNK